MLQFKNFLASLLFGAAALLSSCSKDDEAVTPVQPQQQQTAPADAKGGRMESGALGVYRVHETIYHADRSRSTQTYNMQLLFLASGNGTGVFRIITPDGAGGICQAYSTGWNSFFFRGTVTARYNDRAAIVSIYGNVTDGTFIRYHLHGAGVSGSGYGNLVSYQ